VDRPVSQGALAIDTGRLFVGCGENTALELLELQPEGKKRMLSHDFIQGYRPQSQEGLR
jgi:methionyl-tRNA formyltransferase